MNRKYDLIVQDLKTDITIGISLILACLHHLLSSAVL